VGNSAPIKWSDFQTLVGDSVDNIPGVPLVGPKIAGEWLVKFGTLENLLARADELPQRQAQREFAGDARADFYQPPIGPA